MEKIIEKLRQYKSPTSGNWREAAVERRLNRDWLRHSRSIAISMHEKMREEGISQTELADRMGCNQQYVSKLLKGCENLTLETISKIEGALNLKILI